MDRFIDKYMVTTMWLNQDTRFPSPFQTRWIQRSSLLCWQGPSQPLWTTPSHQVFIINPRLSSLFLDCPKLYMVFLRVVCALLTAWPALLTRQIALKCVPNSVFPFPRSFPHFCDAHCFCSSCVTLQTYFPRWAPAHYVAQYNLKFLIILLPLPE